jgi:4-amino-4-deoxy-L-arabinose transferase-like glycosyltransferase
MTATHSYYRPMLFGLLALSSLLYIGTAGSSALVDDDVDAAHALVSREMLQRHDFVVPYMDGIRYLIRPPMHFWLVAASYALLGESAFATRLPLALAMIGLVLLTFAFGRRFFGDRAGLYGALAVATSAGMFIFTRTMIPEAIYAFEFTAIFYLFLRAWTGSLSPRAGYWGAAAMCGLAMLTRGLIGLIFPAGAIIGFITLSGGWRRWRELRIFSSCSIALAIAAPWHVLAALRTPGFLWAYFVNEYINRALGTRLPHDYSAVPLWLWWVEHLAWLFPWSFFVPLAIRQFPGPRTWKSTDPETQARLLLFLWAGVIMVFFSIESGSRMEYYSFGAWPALALLLGLGIARAEEALDGLLMWIARFLAGVGVLAGIAAGTLIWMFSRVPGSGDFAADVQTHDTDFYQSSMAHVLDLSLLFAFVVSCILRERRRHAAATIAVAIGMAGFFLAANIANKAFEPSLSSRALALEINRTLRPEDWIAIYGDIRVAPGVAFYSNRRVLLYNATGSNLEFGSHYPDAPKVFYTDEDFLQLWSGPRRIVLIAPTAAGATVLTKLPGGHVWQLAGSGGKTVYVNQPVHPGQPPLGAGS